MVSRIDYVIVNEEGRAEIERIEVVDRIESDEMPMRVKVKERIKADISERADWSEAAIAIFKEKLKVTGKANSWSETKEKVNKATSEKKRTYKDREEEECRDKDFRIKRTEVFKQIRRCRNNQEEKQTYYKKRREY